MIFHIEKHDRRVKCVKRKDQGIALGVDTRMVGSRSRSLSTPTCKQASFSPACFMFAFDRFSACGVILRLGAIGDSSPSDHGLGCLGSNEQKEHETGSLLCYSTKQYVPQMHTG